MSNFSQSPQPTDVPSLSPNTIRSDTPPSYLKLAMRNMVRKR